MKISFYNIGCKVNFAETAQLQDDFKCLGYEVVEFGEDSDIIFINTCTVTHKAAADSRKIIRRAIRQNPNAYIAIGGCYAQLDTDELSEIEGVDGIFGANEKFKIAKIVEDFSKQESPQIFTSEKSIAEFFPACSADSNLRMRAVLKLQDGCDYFCSYCAVPYARGRSRSMPFGDIAKYLHDIERQGYHEVVLTGINLGDYRYGNKKFADVLNLINSLSLKLRVRISSLEPDLITDEIISAVASSEKICPHFHIPLQSGSDSILKMMRRRYDTEYFRNLINKINSNIPDCGIGIDLIVGFPGESDNDFVEAYEYLSNLTFSYLHVFSYSDRKIAQASSYPNKVNSQAKKARTNRLLELSSHKSRDFAMQLIGRKGIVIPEIHNFKTKEWSGWTDNYVRCIFSGSKDIGIKPYQILLKSMNDEGTLVGENIYSD